MLVSKIKRMWQISVPIVVSSKTEVTYKNYVRPIIQYGSEVLCMREKEMKRLWTEKSVVRAM